MSPALATLVACSTTLDPTSVPECGENQGQAGAAPATCVDLPPCLDVGENESHFLCEHALSYEAASHECQLRGGHLAEISSAEENDTLAQATGQAVGTNIWLGGTRTEAFVWSWEKSQVVFWRGARDGAPEDGVFVKWAPGEPNNSSTVSDEPEKCLALTLGGSDWNDRACSLELPFACEID